MKKVKTIKHHAIYEQSEKEIQHNTNGSSSKYLLFTPDEMEQPSGLRYYEFEADNVQELVDFVG
jgi:hypothetical protein